MKEMKKIVITALALLLALSLAACGGKGGGGEGAASSSGSGDVDVMEVAEDLVEDAIVENAFSVAAAEAYWKIVAGVDKSATEPDWEWVIDEEKMGTYGDKPDPEGYGHGCILFEKKDGSEISEEEFESWARKVFAATAAASDSGHNIVGWEFVGEGEDALSEVTFEKAFEGFMQGWGFLKNGRHLVVYLSEIYDTNKDSEIGRVLYYYGAQADIAVGMQKSFDETWGDMEDAFEEYGDEIEDALKNY